MRPGLRVAPVLVVAAWLAVASSPALPPGPADTLELFVSPTGDDAWSGRRAEPEGTDGPFATIGRARDEVRRSAFGRSISRMSVPAREGDGRGRRPRRPPVGLNGSIRTVRPMPAPPLA